MIKFLNSHNKRIKSKIRIKRHKINLFDFSVKQFNSKAKLNKKVLDYEPKMIEKKITKRNF